MTSNRLKSLARLRLILSVIALLLVISMITSGVMHFIIQKPAPPDEPPSEPTGATAVITEPETIHEPEFPTEEHTPYDSETEEEDEDIPSEEDPASPIRKDPERRPADDRNPGFHPYPDPVDPGDDIPIPPEADTPADPGTNTPADPDTNTPADPGTNTPADPGANTPADPGTNTPVNPGTNTPANPGTNTPANPGTNTPADPGTNTPANPGTNTPANPGTNTPANPGTNTPANPGTNTPANPGTNTPADGSIIVNTSDSANNQNTIDSANLSTTESDSSISSLAAIQEDPSAENKIPWDILFWCSAVLLAVDMAAIMLISYQIDQELKRLQAVRKHLAETNAHARRSASDTPSTVRLTKPAEPTLQPNAFPRIATIHQIGRRDYQQDSSGHTAVFDNKGILAVLADGMGGLSGGERVSQRIVMDALSLAHQLHPGQANGVLWKIVDKINENVNQMLGPDGLYKSGSTLVAILASDGLFQWIAVGDSRIYLYRQGYANQLNHDHDHLQVQMADVLSGRCTMEEALRNPDSRKLTSFIGMGQLKYVDGSHSAIALEAGDRLVLMSDGVYNIVSEDRLAEILKNYPDVEQAASVIDRLIRESNHPHQDNYTAILLGF